jgi:LysM repeat protein
VEPTPEPAPQPTIHKVRPGENLSFIAGCYFVNWRDLYTLNRDKIGPNPDAIKIGMKLEIPSKDYHGQAFTYTPTVKGGELPAGLTCSPDSPKAQAQACDD